ncbi:MAG: NADH-quinone oxidoreductase subunit N [Burkholderiaceae bacterium]|nr:NADH-quinone oxidoreductase subunit N [Burkholderiaceae bacterium]
MPIGEILPEIVVLASAIVALLAAAFAPQRWQWAGAPLALSGLLAASVLCFAQLDGAPHLTFSGAWAVDGAGIWARLLILVASALAIVLAPHWLQDDRRHGEYYAVVLLSVLGVMLLAGAADTLQLVVGLLLASVTGYTLAAYHRDWALSVEAGMKYFLIGAFTNALLLIGVTLLFGLYGSTRYAVVAQAAAGATPSPVLLLASTLVVIGVALELGAAPAHVWLPDVAQGAPAPAAAFLSTVPKIGAAVALARLVQVLAPQAPAWHVLIATLAAASMTLGNLAALWQTDVRRLLGWSSVSQAGYALMALTVIGRTDTAVPALLFFLAGYAVANLAAFAVVTHLRGRTELAHYAGLASVRPWSAAILATSLLSLVGIPPLAGFVGKLTLFIAVIDAGYAWLAVLAVVNTVVSLFYYLRVIEVVYFGARAGQRPVEVLGAWSAAGMLASGALVVAVGGGAHALWTSMRGAQLLP